MDAITASLIGAAIGAASALGAGYLTSRRQAQIEREKWLRSRRDEREKDLRLAVGELSKKLAVGTHTIAWLTWKAKFTPKEFTKQDIASYDRDMHSVIPELVGSRVIVIALDTAAHDKISPLIERLYALDARISKAPLLLANKSKDECLAELARCYEAVLQLDQDLLHTIPKIARFNQPPK